MIKVKLTDLLKSKGRTKYWLAKQTQISANSIGRIVEGKTSSIGYDILDRICIALQCQVEDVLEHIIVDNTNKEVQ